MTNKEKYINSFSGVEPSDEIKERILSMTTKKRKCSLKAFVTVLAVLMLVAIAMFTANAATDGELGERIKEVSYKVIVLFNGKEFPVEVERTETIDENGNKGVVDTIYLTDVVASFESDENGYEVTSETESK